MDIRQQKGAQPLCKTQNEARERDQQNFLEKLKDFPHFFQLQGCSELKMERKLSILSRLESERNDYSTYVTPAEVTAMSNVTAFVLFLTNDKNKAVRETEQNLTSFNNENNIVALANMAVMKWKMGDRAQGEELLKKLNGLRSQVNFEDRVMDAEAEMGYCYSRLGLPFALHAVNKFEKVVEARPFYYTWKLGLALVLRRLTHMNSTMHSPVSSQLTQERSMKAFDLLVEIRNSNAPPRQKAQALVELGTLLEQYWNTDLSGVMERAKEEGITDEQCYENAVQLAPTDVHVLEKCGKFFRMKNELDRSRELLKRSIAIRPTTIAHHYLGNTFEKMAKLHQKELSKKRSGKVSSYPVEQEEFMLNQERKSAENREYSMQRDRNCHAFVAHIFKSPKKVLPLRLDQMYVEDALYNYQESIKLSYNENTNALYDLGLLYIRLSKDDEALNLFATLINENESRASPLQIIHAHEQSGLIYMRKRSREENDKGRRLLQTALQMQCQVVSSLPTGLSDFKTLWPSFYELCNAAKTRSSPDGQMKEFAMLFEMVTRYPKDLNVLNEISKFSPQQAIDAEFLEKKLICYVDRERYDDALLFLSMLETTKEKELVRQWSDPDLPTRVRVLAAKKMLLNINNALFRSIDVKMIKKCFLQAITAKSSQSDKEAQRKCMDNGWGEDLEQKWWHVMILHDLEDDHTKDKGLAIKNILQTVCGLRVTCMSDDDDCEVWKILENAEISQILLVLCGTKDFSDEFCDNFLQVLPGVCSSGDSVRKSFLALQTDDARRPEKLHPDDWFQCPPSLFEATNLYTPEMINDICNLFCFLADVDID